MIDTIVLNVPVNKFITIGTPPPYSRIKVHGNNVVEVLTSKRSTRHLKEYLPKLSRLKPPNQLPLIKIEFSIPKLLYGNNLQEVDENSFPVVLNSLVEKLSRLGFQIEKGILEKAKVTTVHYSKNVIIKTFLSIYTVLKELNKVNQSKKLDFNSTDYRNSGHCVKFRTNTFELVFYDKIKDLQKAKVSVKRSVDNDPYDNCPSILEDIMKARQEILRIEVRLNNRNEIKKTFKSCDITYKDLTFSEVCNKEFSKKIILSNWKKILDSYLQINNLFETNEHHFIQLIADNNYKRLQIPLQMFGLKVLVDEMGFGGLREMLKQFSPNTWYRLLRAIKNYKFSPPKNLDFMNEITKSINEFQLIK